MSAYTPYDLLRTLVERVGWPTEVEKRVALESITEWESTNAFGNLVKLMNCKHEDIRADGTCDECGKQIESGSASPHARRLRSPFDGWR